ncbi:ABC transporter permease [Vibrio cholerae]|jgi:arginine/ornithine transport system permease protein|uniref:Histidine/lysine/arginine/ornithine transport system permease protein HisM n=2 Tax=Vibrio TaxID=662 RepID=A0AAX1QQQ5_9VIBR|nr:MULTISPECIES: ABC transporter permease [Vibrio]KQA24892.1 amino acid ABC transporter permease [Vibrio paracholerae 877-163]AKB05962.1 amino ABC transporter, permease, 3-TM region, His/Glu/Gln/Arg/opine family domain protein [Vibrio cholerae]EGR5060620.1 ABC transporter permease [Vibrio cholerae]EGS59461.1 amino ABC transporter, permease, 3-TM region, His/Glu/Gln/Arg/opine family domain protein [Vibrio paracholerae HE-09]EGS61286.1 amino ABC transporter, permease, 3-TM region, His/Glu/Gln/Ar
MDFSLIIDSLPIYLSGLWTTVWLVSLSLVIGLLCAIPLAIARNSKQKWFSLPAWGYIYFLRGTPLLVQLYLIYYGMDQWFPVKDTLWEHAWFCALVAFILNTSAYTAEIIRGAINGLPKGEVEAAKAYGMSRLQTYQRIILPSALRRSLPAYSNEVIFMLHGSAVAGIVTIMDLTGAARLVNSRYYAPFEAFLSAGLFYMALTFIILWCFKQAEQRFLAYLKPRS